MSADSERDGVVREHLRLPCGCEMEIARDRLTAATQSRTIHRRHRSCWSGGHRPGARVYLWELLPRMRARSLEGR